jgi:hypothetical protein
MGKPDALDRLVQILIVVPALFSLVNGAFMIWNPQDWYQLLPTVQATGAFNQHFIRDIGLAYITCGMILGLAWHFPSGRWLAALAGALWLTLHGAFHVWELLTGIGAPHVFWMDAPGVLGPPLMVWIALGMLVSRQRIAPAGIPKGMFLRVIDRMAPGESAYMHEVGNAPGHASALHAGHDAPLRRARRLVSHDPDWRNVDRGLWPMRIDRGPWRFERWRF